MMVEDDLQGILVVLSSDADAGSESHTGHSHTQNHPHQLVHRE